MRFTTGNIKALKPKLREYVLREIGSQGFSVKVTPKGNKSFFYIYKLHGKLIKKHLGTFPQVTPDEARASWETKRLVIVPSSASLPSLYRQISEV